jgi:hypothetical protein
VVDLIRFEGEEEDWIRLTYYRHRRSDGRWIFAGQTSFSKSATTLIDLFRGAVSRPWFRRVIEGSLGDR